MRNLVFAEYLNANSVRAFPLSEAASRTDVLGAIKIPDSLIVAASINATPDYADGNFYVSRLGSFPGTVELTISYASSSEDSREICRVSIGRDHVINTNYGIVGQGEDSAITGSITIGDIQETNEAISGFFSFLPEATPFEVSAIFLSLPAVRYIEIYSGRSLVGRYNSVLRIRAGQNIRIEHEGDDVIRIDAVGNLNLSEEDQCDTVIKLGPPIRSINGIPPDADGNFTIDGSECINIDGTSNGIQVRDTCSKSCCGCDELQSLVAGLKELQAQLGVVRGNIDSVRSTQTEMISNLVTAIS